MNKLKLIFGALVVSTTAWAEPPTYHLPAVDVGQQKAAVSKQSVTKPLQYAVATQIEDIHHRQNSQSGGQWTQLSDGGWEFNLRFASENATSLNVGMTDFFLPHSAELWVYTDDQSVLRGPYNDTYNPPHGHFWVGDVPSDHLNIKITVSQKEKQYLSFVINNVPRGFDRYWEKSINLQKSGSCNVDVACPVADGWDDPINSVGWYTFTTPEGSSFCTGQMINNTAEDSTPYFLTAHHCIAADISGNEFPLSVKESIAASIGVIWNYQSLTCRDPGSSASGTPIARDGFNDRQAGATYLASNEASDFALVQLNEIPLDNFNVYFTGWDRSDAIPSSAFTIHHPSLHAKRFSVENDPLTVTERFSSLPGNEGYFRIADWDVGTTEGGSSGGGLWNANQLLVGQLLGGSAACGNDAPDWYGRFAVSWDRGTNSQSRLSDWLDPDDTGQETLSGSDGCLAPTVQITQSGISELGELLNFSAQVSGGTGGYSYQWDLGADGSVERTGNAFEVRFNQEFVGNLKLTVRDSSGCGRSTNQALVVAAPDIQLQEVVNIRENLDQVCGNNNSVIDPGERWSTLLMAQNVGNRSATDAYLALGKQRGTDQARPSDDFGNTWDNCTRSFIDISSTGTELAWEAAGPQFPADDDGSTLVQLTQSFEHYGQTVSQLRASSNGYFSTATNINGGDWDNDCPIPASPNQDGGGARIFPLHDDLKDSVFYQQFFDSCPRPAETGGDQPCEVFMWQGADLFNTGITEAMDVQAILYPETSQWVFQYAGDNIDGSGASVGYQNALASDGLSAACNSEGAVNASAAFCVYNRDFQPATSGSDFMVLESPVISLGDMAVNESQSRTLNFAVTEDAQCGSQIRIDLQAAVYDEGFNAGENNIFSQVIGNNGQCNVVTTCGVGDSSSVASNDFNPRRGLWWNPSRDGNGFDWYTIDRSSLVYLFYTGEQDGEPVWYLANDADAKHNQYFNNVTRYQVPGGFGQGQLAFETVGWSNTSFIDDSNAIQVREINGNLSAEKLEFFQYGANNTPSLHTGLFFTPSEAGWGQSVGTLGDARVVINYLYTDAGQPYWTIASGPNDNSLMDTYYFKTFCPSCPAIAADGRVVGGISLSLNGQLDGTLNQYNVTDDGVNWSRSNLPVINLIPPEGD